jgi:hypothetical protein
MHHIMDASFIPKLAMCYHPLRVFQGSVYEGVTNIDGVFFEAAGAKSVSAPKIATIGITALIPLFNQAQNSQTLEGIFQLICAVLKGKSEEQLYAISSKFFYMVTEALMRLPAEMITPEVVAHLKDLTTTVIP